MCHNEWSALVPGAVIIMDGQHLSASTGWCQNGRSALSPGGASLKGWMALIWTQSSLGWCHMVRGETYGWIVSDGSHKAEWMHHGWLW